MQPVPRRSAVARALPILLVTLLGIAVIAYIFLQTADAVNQNALLPTAACEGVANGRLPLYAPTSGTHPVSAFRSIEERWVPDAQAVAADWIPAAPNETELVLCILAAEPLTHPTCDATEATVYGYAQPLRLVAAATADIVAETVISSSPPPDADCLATAVVAPPQVTTLQIQAWLSRFAYIP
jgi:hypothetical protein